MVAKKVNPKLDEGYIREMKIEEALTHALFAGEPTYFFKKGDNVVYGAWEKATVVNVFNNGLVYEIEARTHKKNEEVISLQIVPWIQVRPYIVGTSNFATNLDIRLSYTNTSIESLLLRHLFFGVDFEPEYQRGEVWSAEDKEKLLESIFMGADIGRFVFRRRTDEEWAKNRISYEIVDGKQRLLTLLAFFENRIPYKGVYYNELSGVDRHRFLDADTAVAELRNVSKINTLKIFLLLNRGGRPVSDKVIKNAEELLSKEPKEQFKTTLFEKGIDVIEDFLGFEVNPSWDKDAIDAAMDEVYEQMPEEELEVFYQKFCIK